MRFRAIVQFLLPALVLGLRARPAAAQAADTATVAPPMPFIVGAYAQGSFVVAHTDAIRHLATLSPHGRGGKPAAPDHRRGRLARLVPVPVGWAWPSRTTIFTTPSWATCWRPVPTSASRFRAGRGTISTFVWVPAWPTSPIPTTCDTNHKNNIASSALNATLQMRVRVRLRPHASSGPAHGPWASTTTPTAPPPSPTSAPTCPALVLGLNYHEQRNAPLANVQRARSS